MEKFIWQNAWTKSKFLFKIKILNKKTIDKNKDEIFKEEKKKIDLKYEKKYKDEVIKYKINISENKNKSNLEKISRKHLHMDEVIKKTVDKLKHFADPNSNEYKNFMKLLIVQSMTQMLEPECKIRVREIDVRMVESLLKDCERDYSRIMKESTGRDYSCKLSMDKRINGHGNEENVFLNCEL